MEVVKEDLFEQIRSNNRAAFEKLFKQLYSPLVRFANEIVKDRDTAEDMVQEVFVKIWEKRHQINIETGIKPYLYMAVKNHCLNALRTEQRLVFLSDDFSDNINISNNQTEQQSNVILIKDHISQALEKLPPRCGLIFKMSRFEEKTYQEIADSLELSLKTVENQMGKALQMMRLYLTPYLKIVAWLLLVKDCW
jgi:RNA polymerase sigma-70 factor (family 1)